MKFEELIKYTEKTTTEEIISEAKALKKDLETLTQRMSDLLEDAPVACALGMGLYVSLAMRDGVLFTAELGYSKGIERAKENAGNN